MRRATLELSKARREIEAKRVRLNCELAEQYRKLEQIDREARELSERIAKNASKRPAK